MALATDSLVHAAIAEKLGFFRVCDVLDQGLCVQKKSEDCDVYLVNWAELYARLKRNDAAFNKIYCACKMLLKYTIPPPRIVSASLGSSSVSLQSTSQEEDDDDEYVQYTVMQLQDEELRAKLCGTPTLE